MIPTHEIEFAEKAIAEFVFSIGNAVRISNMFKNWANTILPHLDGEARDFLKEVADELRKLEPKEEEEVFYKIGDRFKCECGIYQLSMIGNNRAALIKVENYGGSSSVGIVWNIYDCGVNLSRITQKEFKRITGDCQDFFTLIKEEEKESEEEEEEIFYEVGDSFESTNRIFELTHIGNNMIVLIEITTNPASYIWQTSYCRKVENTHKITQEEFLNISNHSPRLFKLIK